MRDKSVPIRVVVVVLCLSVSQGIAAVMHFNDGQIHDVDYEINDSVWVDYQAPGMKTTLNLLDDGYIRGAIAHEDSIINISGGDALGAEAFDNSIINISGGSIEGDFNIYDSSRITMSGGSIGCLWAYGSNHITLSGGAIIWLNTRNSQIDISGGAFGWLDAWSSQVDMSGGSFDLCLGASGYSQVSISGGSIGSYLGVSGYSQVSISGGSIGEELRVFNDGVLIINGRDFALDGQLFGYGELTSTLGGSYADESRRRLTGTLASGELLDNDFRIGNDARIVLIPEPASVVMLGLGAVALVRRRKNKEGMLKEKLQKVCCRNGGE